MISGSSTHRERGSHGLVVLTQQPGPDGAIVACRPLKAKHSSPHQLSLARCNLQQCFWLEGEEDLRLLNLSHNQLKCAAHLDHLTSLVYVDLSSNLLQDASGLGTLQSLRVLMMGRNHITSIDAIKGLQQLEVLDVHSNRLATLAALPHLPSLRVVNASSNAISSLCCLTSMNLIELNLRRNAISSLEAAEQHGGSRGDSNSSASSSNGGGSACALPHSLRRLSIAHNQMASTAALAPLRQLTALAELAVDGNPFGQLLPPLASYRAAALDCCPLSLAELDMQLVTPEERVAMLNGERRRKLQALRAAMEQAGTTLAVHGNMPLPQQQPVAASQEQRLQVQPPAQEQQEQQQQRQQEEQQQQRQEQQQPLQQSQQSEQERAATAAAAGQAEAGTGPETSSQAGLQPAQMAPAPSSAPTGAAHPTGRRAEALQAAAAADDAEVMELIQRLATAAMSPRVRPGPPAAGTGLQAARQHHDWQGQQGVGAEDAAHVGDGGTPSGAPGQLSKSNAAGPPSGPIHQDSLKKRMKAKHMKLTDRFHEEPPPPPPSGVHFEENKLQFDGRVLAQAGEVLMALRSASYANATEVTLTHLDVTEALSSRLTPALAALTRLSGLNLENVGLATLQQLHPLVKLTRLTSLSIRDCPINALVLLRPYVVCRMPALLEFNDVDICQEEYEEATAMFGPLDAALESAMAMPAQRAALTAAGFLDPPGSDSSTTSTSRPLTRPASAAPSRTATPQQQQPGALLDVLARATGPPVPKPKARQQAERYTQKLLGEAVAVQAKLEELERLWPLLAKQYIAEGWDGAYNLPS